MSRIENLKKQNPDFTIEIIDILNSLFDKVKYTELSVNLIKNRRKKHPNITEDLINDLVTYFGQDRENLSKKTYEELVNITRVFYEYFGNDNFNTIKKFVEYNEKGLIKENDLSKFKSFEDLELQVSLAALKLIDKDLEKQIIKLYETDEWLLIKPMSFLASKKYGANTKWCTTMDSNPDHYIRYSRRGILIYCLNKLNGEKVGVFKNLDETQDKELSFWNIIDVRIDSMESGLPSDVLDIIKNDLNNTKKTNWELLTEEERNKELMWIEKEYYQKNIEVLPMDIEIVRDIGLPGGSQEVPRPYEVGNDLRPI